MAAPVTALLSLLTYSTATSLKSWRSSLTIMGDARRWEWGLISEWKCHKINTLHTLGNTFSVAMGMPSFLVQSSTAYSCHRTPCLKSTVPRVPPDPLCLASLFMDTCTADIHVTATSLLENPGYVAATTWWNPRVPYCRFDVSKCPSPTVAITKTYLLCKIPLMTNFPT